MKTLCTKHFRNYPAAHRQHDHKGHCSLIHGHDWSFRITFDSDNKFDNNGFVQDFGDLQEVKTWLTLMFDHTLLLNEDDPYLKFLGEALNNEFRPAFAKIVVVKNCGAEGIGHLVFKTVNEIVGVKTNDRVYVRRVEVFEDDRNSATVEA